MSVGDEKPGAAGGGQVPRRRRRWSDAQKRQIVAETCEPGVSVPMVAQRYNLMIACRRSPTGFWMRLPAGTAST